jgi:hypothetical protein
VSKEIFLPASRVEVLASFKSEVEPRSEREIIEKALAETRGRVSGRSGAAARLGIPPSTVDHRIRALKINKKAVQVPLNPILLTRFSKFTRTRRIYGFPRVTTWK